MASPGYALTHCLCVPTMCLLHASTDIRVFYQSFLEPPEASRQVCLLRLQMYGNNSDLIKDLDSSVPR